MEDKRKWCYGMSEFGKFHDSLDERWEVLEKGEEMARERKMNFFYIARVGREYAEDKEKIEVGGNNENERIDVSELNKKADKLGFLSSRKSHFLRKKM